MKFTQGLLEKIEKIIEKSGYKVRYEKGNFKGGYCLLEQEYIVVVNKFFPLEGKINTLMEALEALPIQVDVLSQEEQKLFYQLRQKKLKF
jgi:hypothetical protein